MDAIDRLMFAGDIPLEKERCRPRYVMQGDAWVHEELAPPVAKVPHFDFSAPVAMPDDEELVLCADPVLGEPCPKCLATTRLIFRDWRVQPCHWCTDGRGTISGGDMGAFLERKRSGRKICYIRTRLTCR